MHGKATRPSILLLVVAMLAGAGCGGRQEGDPDPVSPSKTRGQRAPAGAQEPGGDIQSLRREEVQAGVRRSLAEGKRPIRAKNVRCPLDIPGIKGQRITCKATIAGRRLPVGVTISGVSARNIRYSIRTPPLPR